MTTKTIRLRTLPELRKFAEEFRMSVCHVYTYSIKYDDTCEDPLAVLHDIDSMIDYLMNVDNSYNPYPDDIVHMLVLFCGPNVVQVIFP